MKPCRGFSPFGKEKAASVGGVGYQQDASADQAMSLDLTV